MSEINSARKRLSSGGEGEANDEGTETTAEATAGRYRKARKRRTRGQF